MFTRLTKRKCRTVAPLLWEYASGELTHDTSSLVSAHIERCASCRAEAEGYRLAVQQIAEYRIGDMPEPRATWQALRTQIEAEDSARHEPVVGRTGLQQTWATASAVLVLLAVLYAVTSLGGRAPKPGEIAKVTPVVPHHVQPEKPIGPSVQPETHIARQHDQEPGERIITPDFSPAPAERPERRVVRNEPNSPAPRKHLPERKTEPVAPNPPTQMVLASVDGRAAAVSTPQRNYVIAATPVSGDGQPGTSYVIDTLSASASESTASGVDGAVDETP